MGNRLKRFLIMVLVFLSVSICAHLCRGDDTRKEQLTLSDCIQLALENHPKLAIYRAKTSQKERDFHIAKVSGLPIADLDVSYSRLSYVPQAKQRFIGNSNNDYQAEVNVKQPLFTGGRISAGKKASKFSLDASRKDYEVTELEVIYGVKNAYYKLLFAEQVLSIQKELSQHIKSFLEAATELYERRKFPRQETILRLQVQMHESEQEVIIAQKEKDIAKKLLLNTMGLGSDEAITSAEVDEADLTPAESLEINDNPELLRSALEIEKAKELVKKAKSGYFPTVDLIYSHGYEWGNWPPEKDTWTAGVMVNLPLWDWGDTKASVEKAKAYYNETKSAQDLIFREISFEMEAARLKYESAQQRLQIARVGQDKAKKSLDIFESRYKDGTVTSLELLDAQQSYHRARIRYAQSLLELHLAKAEMEKVAGKEYELK